jgi:hypothetical protein
MFNMTIRAIPQERLALPDANLESIYGETLVDDYEYLLDLANDIYFASLETLVVFQDSLTGNTMH